MSPTTLKELKKQIRRVHAIYEVLVKEWNGKLKHGQSATYPITVIVSILLQNMGFDASDCSGYSHEKAEKELYSKFKTLKALNDYEHQGYMTHFAFVEVESLILGYSHEEE